MQIKNKQLYIEVGSVGVFLSELSRPITDAVAMRRRLHSLMLSSNLSIRSANLWPLEATVSPKWRRPRLTSWPLWLSLVSAWNGCLSQWTLATNAAAGRLVKLAVLAEEGRPAGGGVNEPKKKRRKTPKHLTYTLCQDLSAAYVQCAGRDLSSPRPPSAWPITPDARLHKCRCAKGEQNKRLSEKSSHRPTVDCQPGFQVEALVLRADKLALLRSARPLCLPHGVGWKGVREGGLAGALWLHQDHHPPLPRWGSVVATQQ